MKRKTKIEKGITLIALIITIVALLILAAVAIASITNDGVLSYAENAATQYNQAVKNEQDTLQGYIDYLNKYNGGTGSGNEGDVEGPGNGNGEGEGEGEVTYAAYSIGDTVTIGKESFYVIEASDETKSTVKLLAKQAINSENLVQSYSSYSYFRFSNSNYWATSATSYPYDLIGNLEPDTNQIVMRAAWDYAKTLDENAIGTLLTYDEASSLYREHENIVNYKAKYWLATAGSDNGVKVWGHDNCEYNPVYYNDDECPACGYNFCIRPVVEITKIKITSNEDYDYGWSTSTAQWPYKVGDKVKVGNEKFYVIKECGESDSEVILLAKESIDVDNLTQSINCDMIEFSGFNCFWASIATSYPYDFEVSQSCAVLNFAMDYAKSLDDNAIGRLLTYDEANLLVDAGYTEMIWGKENLRENLRYWLGSAESEEYVYYVSGNNNIYSQRPYKELEILLDGSAEVRPVVKISRDKVSV